MDAIEADVQSLNHQRVFAIQDYWHRHFIYPAFLFKYFAMVETGAWWGFIRVAGHKKYNNATLI